MSPKQKPPKTASPVVPIVEQPKSYPSIAAKREAEYLESRRYEILKDSKGLNNLTPTELDAYESFRVLEDELWRTWPDDEQKSFLKKVEQQKIPRPLPKPEPLGKDSSGRDIDTYTVEEYEAYERTQSSLARLRKESAWFRESKKFFWKSYSEDEKRGEIEDERNRRKLIGRLQRKTMGKYEGNPEWDDVVPIPQDDGEGALAQIAYTEEYAEVMGYFRAIVAAKEHSPRVLDITEHIINLNTAHYTVWLYRAATVLALNTPINEELDFVNEIALDNEKNYQIWHHRQILIDHIYPTIASDPVAIAKLAKSEQTFMTQMFNSDSKNYHVWAYRQYLVRKLNMFDDSELKAVKDLLHKDVRNNSAWSHRFFIVFSDPAHSTSSSKAADPDPLIPAAIIDREIEFAKAAAFEAPQNQSPWNYLRGVLRKGGRGLATEACFASEFIRFLGEEKEDVKSSHALDFLADAWAEEGKVKEADLALRLLGSKYDRVRLNYWEWKRELLQEVN